MDNFSADRIFRSLALERTCGEKMVSQKIKTGNGLIKLAVTLIAALFGRG